MITLKYYCLRACLKPPIRLRAHVTKMVVRSSTMSHYYVILSDSEESLEPLSGSLIRWIRCNFGPIPPIMTFLLPLPVRVFATECPLGICRPVPVRVFATECPLGICRFVICRPVPFGYLQICTFAHLPICTFTDLHICYLS